MYLSLLTLIVAEAIFLESRSLLVYAAVVWLVSHLFVILYEEPTLAHRFGASYDAYRSSVPRWLPRLSPSRGRESESRA
jgi:protein-S-isoprenylcysteine O-methyltransferase Ste14